MRIVIKDLNGQIICNRDYTSESDIVALVEGVEEAMAVLQKCGVPVDTDGWIDWDNGALIDMYGCRVGDIRRIVS